jgi:hypothetical protein
MVQTAVPLTSTYVVNGQEITVSIDEAMSASNPS